MAGETYKILDLDIDYSKLVKSTTEAKIRVSQLKEEMAQLKKENKEGTDEYVKLEAELKSASNDLRINQKIITDLTSANNAQTASVDQMRKMLSVVSAQWAQLSEEERNNTAEGKNLAKQKLELTEQLKKLEAATGDNRRNVGNYTESIKNASDSLGLHKGVLGDVINTIEGVKSKVESLIDIYKKQRDIYIQQIEAINKNTSATEASTLSTEANVVATEANTIATESSTVATGGLSKALNIVKIAFASTGVGALIIALGFLITYLTQTAEGTKFIARAFEGVKAVLNVVTGFIVKAGEALYNAVTNPVQSIKNIANAIETNIINRFKAVADIAIISFKILKDIATLDFKAVGNDAKNLGSAFVQLNTGLDIEQQKRFAESIKNTGSELAKAAIDATSYKKALQEVTKEERDLMVERSKTNKEIAKARFEAEENANATISQKKAAFKKVAELEDETTQKEIASEKKKFEALKGLRQQKLDAGVKASSEELDALAQSEAKIYDLEKESDVRKRKLYKQLNTLDRQQQAERENELKKIEDSVKKKAEAIQKAHEQTIKSMEDELALMEAVAGKERANENEVIKIYKQRATILQKQREYGQISEKKYQAELIKLQDEYVAESKARLAQLADARIKDFQDELAVHKLLHESKLQDGQLLTDELIAQEIERLKAIKDQDEQLQYERYESGKISANEYLAYQLEADKQFLEQQDALYKEHKQQQDEAKAIDLANDYEIRRLQGESELSIRISQLDEAYKAEIAAAEKVGADTTKIQQKYALQQKAIEKELTNTKLKVASDFLGTFSELVGKQTAIGKAAAIAKATIDTYQAANAAYAAMAGIPIVGPALGAVAAATAVAAGIVNIRNIAKAERGGKFGTVRGNYHSSGGTKYYGEDGNVIEMEKDENFYVLNRGASRAINSLSSLNEYYGGVGFSNSVLSGHYADGGMVARQLAQDVDISSQVAKGVADGIKDFKAVVAVEDIITGVDNKVSLVDGSSI